VNGHILTPLHPALVHHGAEGRNKATSQDGRRIVVDFLWQPHQVGIGMLDGYVFRERTPMSEARL
jgi:hypothetical protein